VEITPVTSDRDLHVFLRLPWRIYRGDPRWVPPLLFEQRQLLTGRHPFFEKAEMRLFLARDGGKVVGRIAAILDHHFLESHRDPVGFFGFFECAADGGTTEGLLGAVRAFLGSKGLRVVRGPVNPSMHHPCGLLIEGFEFAPAFLMPYNPPAYQHLLEGAGCRKAKDLLAYRLEIPAVPPHKVARSAAAADEKDIRVRPINMQRLSEEVEIFRELYNAAWQHNWGFTPMTSAEVQWMARHMKPLLVPALTLIAETQGQPIGFIMLLPDYNQVLRHLNGRLGPLGLLKFFWYRRRIRDARLILLGVRPDYRGKGVDALLYRVAHHGLREGGFIHAEISWVLEDNWIVLRISERWGGVPHKRYRIYELPV
jgi:GNAT superfamily N-acetyltransferase